jgi:DHA2 family multidrug resistance protein
MSNTYDHPPLPAGRLTLVTLLLALAVFMNVLDISIANVSIPTIAGNLAVSADQGTWIITSFAVANAVAVPISGWLARRFGEVRLFVICTLLFTLFSFLCGFSFSFPMLLAARALQGAAAGPMIPISQSLLLANYPHHRRGFANGIWGMTAVVGPVAGPVLGGVITDSYSWHWIFYINVPIGILAAIGTWLLLRARETPMVRNPIDRVGLALLIVGVACLQIMLDQGNDRAWFSSPYIVTLGIAAALGLSLFVAWELTGKHPLVDLKLFRRRNFTVATVAMTFGFMAYFNGVVLLPLWLQSVQGYDATWAGIATASLGVLGVVFSPLVGRLTDKFDVRIIVTVGMVIFAVLSFMKADANTSIDFQHIVLTRLPWGIGMSCFFIPLITLSMSGLHGNEVAAASGLFNFVRLLALSVGTSISVSLWDGREAFHDQILTSAVQSNGPALRQWLADAQQRGVDGIHALGQLALHIEQQSFMLALNDMYWLSGVLFIALSALVWMSRPQGGGEAPAGAH